MNIINEMFDDLANDLLVESTYNMKRIEAYFNEINPKIGEGVKRDAVSLTKSFHENFPEITKSSKIYLILDPEKETIKQSESEIKLESRDKSELHGAGATINKRTEAGTRQPTAIISIYFDRVKNPKRFKNIFIHELIHILDGLRRYSKTRHIPKISSTAKTQMAINKAREEGRVITPEEYANYRKNIDEFNEAVNMIARFKDGVYNKIQTIDELVKWFVERASGQKFKNDNFVKFFKEDVEFRKKLISRLYREGLLPKALENREKIDSKDSFVKPKKNKPKTPEQIQKEHRQKLKMELLKKYRPEEYKKIIKRETKK